MTTPKQPKPTTGRILEPSKLAVTPFHEKRVYPDGNPDDYGQVNDSAKDRSRLGTGPSEASSDHYHSDADSSQASLHHTLGSGRNQASPGNHSHDGSTSPKIGPREMDPVTLGATRPTLTLTGAKGGNAALASLIAYLGNFFEFRDLTT